jgi:citrate synthase
MSELEIHRGLAGVVADTTAISEVNEATNSLLYRGYPVQDLAASCSFEEVAYLIWHGDLPTASQLQSFEKQERSLRTLPGGLSEILGSLPVKCHPMDVLRTGVSHLGASDPREDDNSPEANLAKSIDLMAKIPTIVAAEQRRRRGLSAIAPDPGLSFAENFLNMCFGEVPGPEVVRSFEISLVLYAEHSFNASTFTARVIISTLSDIYSAVTGAIGALKGPLHGGANEAVMYMFNEIGDPDRATVWLGEALAAKRKIMGFGHRVYKHGDSRVPTMYAALKDLAGSHESGPRLLALYDNLAGAMLEAKGIYPNLDFPSGPAYDLIGFDIPIFTPIFVVSRITGWTAHVIEQLSANSLIRPLSAYVGPVQRSVPPREARGLWEERRCPFRGSASG